MRGYVPYGCRMPSRLGEETRKRSMEVVVACMTATETNDAFVIAALDAWQRYAAFIRHLLRCHGQVLATCSVVDH
jgi:hypothetical protein